MIRVNGGGWYDRLPWLSLGLLVLAMAHGLFAGAIIGMYYDVVPDMGAHEDRMVPIQLLLFLLAILVGMPHFFGGILAFRQHLGREGVARLLAFAAPLLIVLATEGLVSHFLWWEPINDSDRFHLLHHTLLTGLPLTLLYGFALRRWWQPAAFQVRGGLLHPLYLVLLAMLAIPLAVMLTDTPLIGLLLAAGGMAGYWFMHRIQGTDR